MKENNMFENNVDNELELDPELTGYPKGKTEEPYEEQDALREENEPSKIRVNEPFVAEPLPPVMPKIEKAQYTPADTSGSSKGIKVFAIITAFMIVAAACTTAGYFFGKSGTAANMATSSAPAPKVDLAKKPETKDAKTVSQIYSEVSKSVVGIYIYNEKGIAGSATGVIYSESGYIITNDHIYSGVANAAFKVYTSDGTAYDAQFVAGDVRSDLAVLKVESPKNFKVPVFGNSLELVAGESVVSIGCYNGATLPANVSEGVVSATSSRVSITTNYSGNYIQTDSVINPGSSGGALCNIYGQVVGITSAKIVAESYDGIGFAIPTVTMKKVADSLIKHGEVKGRAKLGITYTEIDELYSEVSGKTKGLEIADIDKKSDLYGKSVSKGDIITHVNGSEIISSATILDIIENAAPKSTITLTISPKKGGKSFDITVKLLEDKSSSSYNTEEKTESELPDFDEYDFEDFYNFDKDNGIDY